MFLLLLGCLVLSETPQPANAGFENDSLGKPPTAWQLRSFSTKQGYRIEVSGQQPFAGKHCLVLHGSSVVGGFGQYGRVTQRLPAESLRGKRVRFRAAVRLEASAIPRNYVALWAAVIRPEFRPGHWTDQMECPCRSKTWQEISAVVDVATDAQWLEVGFTLQGEGIGYFDTAALDVVGDSGAMVESPQPLTDRGVENLVAFSKLLGYVRYFHPSDEVANTDWERFTIEAIRHVETATTPEDLARRLNLLFAPVAPLVQVFPTGKMPPLPEGLQAAPTDRPTRIVAWRHFGVLCNSSLGHFRSERVVDRELPGFPRMPRSPEPQPKPSQTFTVDLGGGVSCRVPLALYADSRGTLPKATALLPPAVKSAGQPLTGDDRSVRLADVALAWSLMQHFYPYFDVVQTDWLAALREALAKAARDPDAAAFHDTLRRMMAPLHDSHTFVRGGSGTVLNDGALPLAWDMVEGHVVVVWVDPAHAGRLKMGDVVLSINGRPAMEAYTAAEQLVSGATPQFRRYRAVQDLRNGPAGQMVTMEIKTVQGEVYRLDLVRQPADDAPLRGPSMREPRLPTVKELEPGIFYVDWDRLTVPEVNAHLQQLETARGIVFDLRGYPNAGCNTLFQRLFDTTLTTDIVGDVVTRRPDRQGTVYKGKSYSFGPAKPKLMAKVAVLTDGRAVSAAEWFLSMVANHKVCPIIGEATAGSDGGVNLYTLPGGYRISWTGQKLTQRDGSPFHGVGVQPTVPLKRTLAGLQAGRDEQLEKALEIVRQ